MRPRGEPASVLGAPGAELAVEVGLGPGGGLAALAVVVGAVVEVVEAALDVVEQGAGGEAEVDAASAGAVLDIGRGDRRRDQGADELSSDERDQPASPSRPDVTHDEGERDRRGDEVEGLERVP